MLRQGHQEAKKTPLASWRLEEAKKNHVIVRTPGKQSLTRRTMMNWRNNTLYHASHEILGTTTPHNEE